MAVVRLARFGLSRTGHLCRLCSCHRGVGSKHNDELDIRYATNGNIRYATNGKLDIRYATNNKLDIRYATTNELDIR